MAYGYDNEDTNWDAFNPDANSGGETEEEKKRREEAEKSGFVNAYPNAPAGSNIGPGADVYGVQATRNTPTDNPGSPGSKTAEINSQWKQDGDPWVDKGDTGGYMWQKGVTIGQGRSITPQEYADFTSQALAAGFTQAQIDAYEKSNPGDMNRFIEGMTNQTGGDNGGSAWSSQAIGSQQSGMLQDLYARLKARMDQSLNVSASDPNIRIQANPYRASVERQRRDYLSGLAERGTPTQNLGAEGRMASEKAGQAVGAYEGQLVGVEVAARRQEIAQALDLYAGTLNSAEERSLRMELAQLDAELRKMGLAQDQSQFDTTLDFNAEDRATYYAGKQAGWW